MPGHGATAWIALVLLLTACGSAGNIAFALNQVVADCQGNADVRSTLNLAYPPANGTSYLLCGNLFG